METCDLTGLWHVEFSPEENQELPEHQDIDSLLDSSGLRILYGVGFEPAPEEFEFPNTEAEDSSLTQESFEQLGCSNGLPGLHSTVFDSASEDFELFSVDVEDIELTEAEKLYYAVFDDECQPVENVHMEKIRLEEVNESDNRRLLTALWDVGQRQQISQGALMKQIDSVLKKQDLPKAISNLADIATRRLPLVVIDRVLYLQKHTVWTPIDKMELYQALDSTMNHSERTVLGGLNDRGIAELFNKVLLQRELTLSADDIQTNPHLIACKDVVYDIFEKRYRTARKDDYFFSCINVLGSEIGRGTGKIFEAFLDNLSGGDGAIRQLFLEVLGVMMSNYLPKNFFLFLGQGDTGKTQSVNLLRKLLGEDSVFSIADPNELSGRWTFGSLQGKRLCFCPDAAQIPLSQQTIAAIKQLSGADKIGAERKYHDPFTFVNESKLLFVSNHPLCGSYDQALLSRLIVVPFRNAVPAAKRIPDLAEKLYAERGYIVGQAVDALQRLVKRHFVFTKVPEVEAGFVVGEIRHSQHIEDFVENECELDEDGVVSTQDLYVAYQCYCEDMCVRSISDIGTFGRTLTATYPQLVRTRNAGKNGVRGFTGIRLVND